MQQDTKDTDLRINAPDKAAGSIEVLSSFQTTADIAGLDQASKEIYKNKEVLAVILKGVVKEFYSKSSYRFGAAKDKPLRSAYTGDHKAW